MNPVLQLDKLLRDGKPLRILNYPQKYSANIEIPYTKLTDIKSVPFGRGHDPTRIEDFVTLGWMQKSLY